MPVANILDSVSMINILPFGMCQSMANPTVAAATAAALGKLTPMPCIPVTSSPWIPGSSSVMISDISVLNHTSYLMCTWGGRIQISDPGQMTVQVS